MVLEKLQLVAFLVCDFGQVIGVVGIISAIPVNDGRMIGFQHGCGKLVGRIKRSRRR